MLRSGPEQLCSKEFGRLLDDQDSHIRVAVLGVNEIHLLGESAFRQAFTQIGFMR